MKQEKYCWWKHGVIYQIYPLSFYDSNNDGYGDLNGLIQKIPYLSELGIETIWLCPIHPSPWVDFGYDVSNYYDIHPKIGTLEDFKNLISLCKKSKIKIILDFVFNHTSTQHPWFQEAKQSKKNPKRDWYLWNPGKGKFKRPPNNWLAAFGGRAWEYDKTTKEYYLHSFDKAQADLNWRNPEVMQEAKKILKYWIDLGVYGFRLDVINFFLKDLQLRNNPFCFGFPPRPYDLQKHLYDRNQKDNYTILKELRSYVNSFPQKPILVGEVYAPKKDPELSASYIGKNNDMLHLSLDFSLFHTKWKAKNLKKDLEKCYNCLSPSSWPSQTFSNHDEGRSFTRFFSKQQESNYKALLTLLFTLKGTPFLYYGEELGLEDGKISLKEKQDLLGQHYWPLYNGRDSFRTPMPWDSGVFGGFSEHKPWIPLSPRIQDKNVHKETVNPHSFLNLSKNLIDLRKREEALIYGNISFIQKHHETLVFKREYQNETLMIAISFSKKNIVLSFEDSFEKIFSSSAAQKKQPTSNSSLLEPYEASILKKI